jgi:type II secretory pathway pseudopilin PulG
MSCRIALVALSVFSLAAAASAQGIPFNVLNAQNYRRSQQQQAAMQQQQAQAQMQPQQAKFKGKIESRTGELLRVSGGDQPSQSWEVYLTRDTKVHVTGTAEADFLKPKLGVEFDAELDAQAKGTNDVGALRVITLSRDKPLGISGGGHLPAKPAAGGAAKSAERGSVRSRTIEPGMHHVVGRVLSFHNNVLNVQAGRKVQVNLADAAKIRVDVNDLSFAGEGDEVTGTGISVPNRSAISRTSRVLPRPVQQNPQGIQNQAAVEGSHIVQAQEIKIEISEPLSSGKKKAAGKSAAKEKETAGPAKKEGDGASKAADEK